MAGLVFLLVFWVLAGACQRHGVGEFIVPFLFLPPYTRSPAIPSTARSIMVGYFDYFELEH